MSAIVSRSESQLSFSKLRRKVSQRKLKADGDSPTKARITPEMISCPNNVQHTGHIGHDGAFFGDVAFLSAELPNLSDVQNNESISDDSFELPDLGPSFMEEVLKELNLSADVQTVETSEVDADKVNIELESGTDASPDADDDDNDDKSGDETKESREMMEDKKLGADLNPIYVDMFYEKQTRSMSEPSTVQVSSANNDRSLSEGNPTPTNFKVAEDFAAQLKRKDGGHSRNDQWATSSLVETQDNSEESLPRCSSDPATVFHKTEKTGKNVQLN